ncbi:MAG: MazG family protein, partial [Oscillospiraceae bacterium]
DTMVNFKKKDCYDIQDLEEIVRLLRAPGGCPWDREQTHLSLRRDFLEECYEAIEAIDTEDSVLLREELGDVLLHLVFHSCIEEEKGSFNFYDVINDITAKMILRHPHVFGDVTVSNTAEILANWDAIKKETKGQKTQQETLESISPAMPALMRSQKVLKKAVKNGIILDDDPKPHLQDLFLAKEIGEKEIGTMLSLVVTLAEQSGVDAEKALSDHTKLFIQGVKS